MIRTALLLAIVLCITRSSGLGQGMKAVSAVRKAGSSVQPDTYTGRQLIVGSGGGFTGLITTYYLLDNGRLYRKSSRDASYRLIGTQKAATTKRLFRAAENQCRIRTTRFDKPGNVSRFVSWRKNKQAYKVTWAVGDSTVPAAYPTLYNAFMAILPTPDQLN